MYCSSTDNDCGAMTTYRHAGEILIISLLSYLGFRVLKKMFPAYKAEFLRAGFKGVDLNKASKPTLPEAQGVLAGAIFIVVMFLFIPVPFWRYLFIQYLAALLCICCMVFLGFADDALNLPWRHKCLLPAVASLPLLMVYLANEGTTQIVVPIFLRGLFGTTVDIGFLYYIYMGMLTVFCTNAINIYAGVNGLEVGQSLVIACSVAVFNVIELSGYLWRVHLFSLYFLIPFIAVCLALYTVNRYPASVFVGDTFCYFAGITLAVVGILGHFSKTLLLFFVPQIINFIYSIPQLFALIPCPRHRLPQFNPDDGLLYPSKVRFHPKSLSAFGEFLLNTCSRFGIVDCRYVHAFDPPATESPSAAQSTGGHATEEEIVEVNNFTLINVVLRLRGPMTEANTTKSLLWFQVACSCLAFVIRYPLAWMFYGTPVN